ncbi:MAG: ADP-ribosylglycohydrolase family protein [Dehalococcoidales bacterium]|nr:ADP-ribosylglycohydrolase family protein [Dehalococcoidales bacterium]
MFGALIGDIIGSRFETNNIKSKEFDLFTDECHFTDDSVLTLAVAKAVLDVRNGPIPAYPDLLSDYVKKYMRYLGRAFVNAGYGKRFLEWVMDDDKEAYGSIGNGAAMRIGPVGYAFYRSADMTAYVKAATAVTHNTQQAIKGAEAVCRAIAMALREESQEKIREYISLHYYPLNESMEWYRENYVNDLSCDGTVPVALTAFIEAESFEDAIRNAISVGGDSDTIAAITGSVAGAFFAIPQQIKKVAFSYLPPMLLGICEEWDRFMVL